MTDDLVDALGDLVEDDAFAGVLGLDDDGVFGGERLLAFVLDDDDQTRIRFSLSTPSEDEDASGTACRCAEVAVEYPTSHLVGCLRHAPCCTVEVDCARGSVGVRKAIEEES